jgi:hypothetical protein
MTYHVSPNPTMLFSPVLTGTPPTLLPLRDAVRRAANDRLYMASSGMTLYGANFKRLNCAWKVTEMISNPRQNVFAVHLCQDAADLTLVELPARPTNGCVNTPLTCPKKALVQTARNFSGAVLRVARKKDRYFEVSEAASAAVLPELLAIQEAFAGEAADELSQLAGAYALAVHKAISRALDAPWRRYSGQYDPTVTL